MINTSHEALPIDTGFIRLHQAFGDTLMRIKEGQKKAVLLRVSHTLVPQVSPPELSFPCVGSIPEQNNFSPGDAQQAFGIFLSLLTTLDQNSARQNIEHMCWEDPDKVRHTSHCDQRTLTLETTFPDINLRLERVDDDHGPISQTWILMRKTQPVFQKIFKRFRHQAA